MFNLVFKFKISELNLGSKASQVDLEASFELQDQSYVKL